MNVQNKAKQHPFVATLIFVAMLATAVGSIWQGAELVDAAVMSEAEAATIHIAFDQQFTSVGTKLTAQARLSECRYLSDKRDRLEYELYVLARDKADADLIQLKTTAFARVTGKYDALSCVTLL